MSNNLFRKGLVAAAVVALGTAGLSAVPAQAASVLFAPSTGTGNTLVAGETFSLTASLSSDLPAANSTQLKFKVTNTTGVAATVKLNGLTPIASVSNESTVVANNQTKSPNNTYANDMFPVALDSSVGGNTATALTGTAGASSVFGVTAAITDAVTYGANDSYSSGNRWAYDTYTGSTVSNATNPTSISIASTAATTADYTVTAWLDANNNGVIDNGELSAAQTVHFVKAADAGAVVTFTQPVQSSSALKATVAFASDVNLAQSTTLAYKVGFGVYGSTGEVSATNGSGAVSANLTNATYTAANGNFVAASGATSTAAAVVGSTYGAQAYVAGVAVGAEVLKTVSATQANSMTQLAPAVGDNVSGSGTSYSVRTGTQSVNLTATVKQNTSSTDATQIAVGAGVVVNYSVTAVTNLGTGSTNDTVSVNGVAITTATTLPVTGTLTTDATGKVTLPVVTGAGAATDSVTVTYSVPNAASSVNGTVTATWANATVSNVTDLNNGARTVVKGGTYTNSYSLTDSFGALVKTGTYQLVFTAAGSQGSSSTVPTSSTIYVPFVNGVASVSFTDNSTGAGNNAVTATVQKQTNGLWANFSVANLPGSYDFTVLAAAPAVAAVSATNSYGSGTAGVLDVAGTYATVDTRLGNSATATPTGFTGGSAYTVSGVVTDVNGVGLVGVPVTVAAAGVQFDANGNWAIGSITVISGTNGAYSVNVHSHTAGKVTFTATAAAASKTTTITYSAADTATGKTLTITAPATALPGQTVNFSSLLVDKFGNPVVVTGLAVPTISVKATGLGVASNATTADATGVSTGYVTLGASDAGTITITATYNFDGATASAPVTATATIKVAAPAAAKNTVAVAASQAQVGAAVDVTAVATDAAGKPAAGVVVSFSVLGQGYLSNATATTNAAGVASVKLVSNVAGMNTVSAQANGVAVAASTAVTFGNADANLTFGSKNRRATATYEFAGNAKVVISVNGVRVKTLYPADDMVGSYSVSLKKGKNKVSVSIAGVTSDVRTVTTK